MRRIFRKEERSTWQHIPQRMGVWVSGFIARWEYKPGSELYLVWNQGNTPYAYGSINDALTKSLFSNAFNSDGRNIFLVKWTYRFLR